MLLLRGCTRAGLSLENRIFGVASRMGGRSAEGLYELYADYHNNDLENFKKKLLQTDRYAKEGSYALPGVNIVTTAE